MMNLTTFTNKIGYLQVTANHRYLEYDDGTPFFYLGDTAWELFHRLDLEETTHYLTNRAAKGFTVIQAVALAELKGLDVPNANDDLPLIDRDPARPNEAYFQHVDAVVAKANELGLAIGMLPTWGCYWDANSFNADPIFTAESALAYGRFLGERYRDSYLIWILGGDRNAVDEGQRDIIHAMAQGLTEGDGGAHLRTYHPMGPGRSAEMFHEAEWLDFNMCQSSHGAHDHDNGLFIDHDYALEPPKPTIDGEPRYETIPVGFYYKDNSPYDRFDDYDVRQAAYWALMAGACGHTYGHNCVWQMWTPERTPVIRANIPWVESLDTPGAFQMGFVRRLFEAYSFQELVPAAEIVLDGPTSSGAKIRAMRARDDSFVFVYSPRGEPFTIDKRAFGASRVKESWYDPRYGCAHHFYSSTTGSIQTYTPPTSGRGNDWILILEAEQEISSGD